jgi:uncharacterized RDD family membrane protein YckC
MNCPRCGDVSEEVCRCDPKSSASGMASGARETCDDGAACDKVEAAGNDGSAWRDELSDRLNRYRSRHKIRPPRYPSLSLPFDSAPSILDREFSGIKSARSFQPIAESSLALDPAGSLHARQDTQDAPPAAQVKVSTTVFSDTNTASAKIIEFPRFAWAPPPPPPDQLAEPVIDRPRILEVPEVTPPPPALGGITIEPTESQDAEKRPGIDFPLQSASLARRIAAAFIDGLIVLIATTLFGFSFWKIVGVWPPRTELVSLTLGALFLFWGVYQYLLVVYSGNTPGLRATGLELARFDGTPAKRGLRRWRILASYLSAASLGMGYAWVFLDEDSLCWHDRITHTYLAPKKKSTSTK